MQDLFRKEPGVVSTRVDRLHRRRCSDATYGNHDGHAEAIEVVFDPDLTSGRQSLRSMRGRWPGKVVTEVTPAGPFWEAEPEHQNYLERYPNG